MFAHARRTRVVLAGLAGAAMLMPVSATASESAGADPCHPTNKNRPVCSKDTPLAEASFVDPTARVVGAGNIALAGQVYVGPFAQLLATRAAPIELGPETNVQDNVVVVANARRTAAATRSLAGVGLSARSGVKTGERVIMAHGSSVRGPARLGVLRKGQTAPKVDSGVFISFGARVDGAVIERDSGLSAMSRVGPGVRLRSGFIVLPGKNITTQAQADNPALGKVRPIVEADRLFNAGVVEVNVGLAREYSRLAREDKSAVRGINLDPGGNEFDEERDAPTVQSSNCTGPEVRRPSFRNRIIGDACFQDSLKRLGKVMGHRIAIRADEGGPFRIGTIAKMRDGVVFHALEGSDLRVGNHVTYGVGAIVHGGGRPVLNAAAGVLAPTVIENNVRLGHGSVVFRSLVRNDARIGDRSVVVGSELKAGQRIPARTIFANGEVFGPVEW